MDGKRGAAAAGNDKTRFGEAAGWRQRWKELGLETFDIISRERGFIWKGKNWDIYSWKENEKEKYKICGAGQIWKRKGMIHAQLILVVHFLCLCFRPNYKLW